MKVYLDTSVVVGLLIPFHPHHLQVLTRFNQAKLAYPSIQFVSGYHTSMEFYSTVSSIIRRETTGNASVSSLDQLTGLVFSFVDLHEQKRKDYNRAFAICASLKLASSAIYDALHYATAERLKANEVWSINEKDFRRFEIFAGPKLINPC